MKLQRRTKRTCIVWIVASVFALTAYPHIVSTGFFRFVATYIMMLSDWKIFRSL
ncbi:hypothetical protein Golob_005419 [Gossypium lobatum]|uniref:Uncharacterized protein n=2 Tax=Gossypium TaxID=3633 RepID=A0A7J8Y296_GOSAI|nr:hypothetical protein [Gossypium lobatum]MBA0693691.1 hypothetical protein [Gossypium aridum]